MLPSVGNYVGLFLLDHLLFEPVLQAFVVSVPDRPIAFARVEEGVLWRLGGVPAYLTLDLFSFFILFVLVDYSTVNLDGLLFSEIVLFLIAAAVPLLYRRMFSLSSICNCSLIFSAEVLYCKL